MPVPPRLGQLPDPIALKKELRLICRQPRGWFIAENAHILMGLDCVRSHVVNGPVQDEEVYADAVRRYLELAVLKVPSPQYRTLLMVVLGLGDDRWRKPEWRSKSLQERQDEAGRHIRKPETVKLSTVRAHQPKAVEALVPIILEDEAVARNRNRTHNQNRPRRSSMGEGRAKEQPDPATGSGGS
ncbi:MAG TPA: hypothetical protein VNU24_06245 [Solirubrobacteraceae bacterium]|jgi:hypothetical protein|nr:hypothetical protein [Solirubrobacteraceae bacterium]